jgi:hypothetical protein
MITHGLASEEHRGVYDVVAQTELSLGQVQPRRLSIDARNLIPPDRQLLRSIPAGRRLIKRVNWIHAIMNSTNWKNAITKSELGKMPL